MLEKIYKLEKVLFYVFIFSIPLQIRKLLFCLSDKFLEWNCGFLYFTDVLFFIILLLWIVRILFKKSNFLKKSDFLIAIFFIIAGLSLTTAYSLKLSIYHLIKLAGFILLFLYVKYNLDFLKIRPILKLVIASGVLQAIIAILQFFKQSDLGLKYFEAGNFSPNIPGVATFFVENFKMIRAYGTTPHPNVLAVFLLASIFFLYYFYLKSGNTIKHRMILVICLAVLMTGLTLTFSRAVIITFIGSTILFLIISFLKSSYTFKTRVISLFVILVIYTSVITFIFWPEINSRFLATSYQEESVTLRIYYNEIAVPEILNRPFLGVGIGNFVWYLFNNYDLEKFWLYQPVHNLYLLIAVEIGMVGVLIFLIFLGKILFKKTKKFFAKQLTLKELCFTAILGSFLCLGLIDHYLWTIQQSSLLFWLLLALINKRNIS